MGDIEHGGEALTAPTLKLAIQIIILDALKRHNGNRTHAAKELGISIRKMRQVLADYRKAGVEVMEPPGHMNPRICDRNS